ncbi:hypothetical protein PSA5_26885 [Pseudomonas syringae pv. actinidiae]|nr:hypothetical protein PSA5_26885 [Pseudomonas syringae pv. actinidiae]
MHIRSTLRPDFDNKGPSHINPLITGTFMSALFSWFLSSYLVAPLMKLREAMGKVARGRFDTRVKPDMGRRRDEIVDLAEDCDRMANQLKVMADSQQQLLHDISHELRSPLTRMSAAIGLLRQEPSQLDMLERVERESEKMDALIEELLTLARMQSHPESLSREAVDVISLLAAIVEDAEFEAGLKQCRVRLQAPGSFVAQVDGELLYRAFENVIRNAVRHTAVGSDVVVVANVQAYPAGLIVNVIDQGPGVDEECLQRIFQPFECGLDNTAHASGWAWPSHFGPLKCMVGRLVHATGRAVGWWWISCCQRDLARLITGSGRSNEWLCAAAHWPIDKQNRPLGVKKLGPGARNRYAMQLYFCFSSR